MFQLIGLCLTGGLASIVGASLIVALKNKATSISEKLTGFAAGVLISVGILDLLPEAFETTKTVDQGAKFVLVGVLFVFLLEKSGLWFHHHDGDHGKKKPILAILFGDVLHNFIDGFAVGATFLVSKEAGIATTIAVALHELPKEMADFMIYLRAGYSNIKTLTFNLLSSMMAVVGGLTAYFSSDWVRDNQGALLAITAGMFIFIALADLVPEMHEEMEKHSRRNKLVWLLIFGFGLTVGLISSSSH